MSVTRPAMPTHPSTTPEKRAVSGVIPNRAKRGKATRAFVVPTYGMIMRGQRRPLAAFQRP
jgi:hypothetical protein